VREERREPRERERAREREVVRITIHEREREKRRERAETDEILEARAPLAFVFSVSVSRDGSTSWTAESVPVGRSDKAVEQRTTRIVVTSSRSSVVEERERERIARRRGEGSGGGETNERKHRSKTKRLYE